MNANELIDQLIKDTQQIILQVEQELMPLTQDALTFKSSPKSWSILECIEHMNIADRHYYDQIQEKIQNQETNSRENYSAGALGNYFTKMMKPKGDNTIPSKMKTFSKFYPVISLQGMQQKSVIESFLKDQKSLIDLLEKARSVDLTKIKITSALGGWLKFRLGDAFRFVIAHNQRHVLQAINTLDEYKNSNITV